MSNSDDWEEQDTKQALDRMAKEGMISYSDEQNEQLTGTTITNLQKIVNKRLDKSI